MAGTIADGIIKSAEKVKEEEEIKATEEAKEKYVKAGQEYDEFMLKNKDILNDQNNPAYAFTRSEWLKKAQNLQEARSAYNKASDIRSIDDVSDINAGWENIDTNLYKEKVGSQVGVLDDSFDWNLVGEAAAGGSIGGAVFGAGGTGFGATIGWLNKIITRIGQLNKIITRADIYMSEESPEATGESFTKHMIGKNRSKKDKYVIGHYDSESREWQFSSYHGDDIDTVKSKMQPYDILINDWNSSFYQDRAVFMDSNRKFRWVNANEGKIYANNWAEELASSGGKSRGGSGGSFASGTLSAPGGRSLINENGLESIITPSGTITSLPAKSGIVPADLTRNLWTLGEVAPNLIARLGGNSLQTNNSNSSTDNSINIQNLDATFNTQSDFDGHRFLTDLRNQVILTANNH